MGRARDAKSLGVLAAERPDHRVMVLREASMTLDVKSELDHILDSTTVCSIQTCHALTVLIRSNQVFRDR